jgi:hypothetical protein
MDLETFFETFIAGIAADTALQTWANANFGKDAGVHGEINHNSPPDAETDAPFCVLVSPSKDSASDNRSPEYGFGVWLVIYADDTDARPDDAIVPATVKLLLQFIEKVKDAIRANLPANFEVRFIEETDTIGAMPEVHGYLDCFLHAPALIGANPLD